MRTREEQIGALACCLHGQDMTANRETAERMVREAEQRVRAQIGRDSERLDWLEKTRFVTLEDAIIGWRISFIGERFFSMKGTVRKAIDAARALSGSGETE
ncbi:hypothetical protein predicted by Glimmer/Critica [Acetobacter senegalensis]|uniref:Uncharacterized protein n=1 Tax=Acetobacter senegalensis TaxID=446692 RepID=A0A0U5ETN6_9PROT|nr:hypothetical protein [Acetobacter senegalensis]CEF41083.1 hypothetical protein predicted by Glimmer/Critica [Acetobacter senegalensis]